MKIKINLLASLIYFFLFAFIFTSKTFAVVGSFSITGNMNYGRAGFSSVLLNSGKVLILGGDPYIYPAELYDPTTETFSLTGSLLQSRVPNSGTATLLPSGKVLIAGGINVNFQIINEAELYDPTTGTFSRTGDMNFPRTNHTAILLPSGKVLIAGGEQNGTGDINTAELYDPTTGTFSSTGNMIIGRVNHNEVLLPNGNVLIIGGINASIANPDPGSTVELYNSNSGTFSKVGNLNTVDRIFATATLLPNGKVLIAGGYTNGCCGSVQNTAEIYDPSLNTSIFTGNLIEGRAYHTATLLNNGEVLLAGGYGDSETNNRSSAELYNPSAGIFSVTGPMNYTHANHIATLLPDGQVLIAGGNSNLAEVYNPNGYYNFPPVVGSISTSPNPVQINSPITVSASFTDQDTSDTHTASWNWGDGSKTDCPPNFSDCTLTESNGSGTITASHTYSLPGVYTITLTVTDNHGAQGQSTFQYLSVYNPTPQGLFSGARIFTSPVGAYPQNPNLTGRVMFGVSIKYDNNNQPTGNVSMDFKDANLSFVATSISSLVTSNGMATVTGSGTVNGTTGYTFFATGLDSAQGGPDIRFQIIDSSNNVIYDSQPGAVETVSPTAPVTGNVVVH